MKKKISTVLLSMGLTVSLFITSSVTTNAEEIQMKDGIYFVKSTSIGEYYSFPAWSNLTGVQKGLLLVKYGQSNIKPYLKSLNKVASLEDISKTRKPFLGASKDYQPGDLPGQYRDFETGNIIITDSSIEGDFGVVDIE